MNGSIEAARTAAARVVMAVGKLRAERASPLVIALNGPSGSGVLLR